MTFLDFILLRDHGTRVVLIGTMLLGAACGVVGSFLLLRKRALLADALSHATLPGVAGAFMVAVLLGASGRSLPVLLLGALVSGVIGVLCVSLLTSQTRLKDDAALGVVLSVFFGIGLALMSIVQQMPAASQAGLESFIFGQAASMVQADTLLIAVIAMVVTATCLLLFKELRLICFDRDFARGQGLPVTALDLLLLGLVTVTTVIGLQAVGLVLVIALLVIPPAAARFWTQRLPVMTLLAMLIGAASSAIGVALSATDARLPSGASIVLVASVLFAISLLFGRTAGVVPRLLLQMRSRRAIRREHLLRSIYEMIEPHVAGDAIEQVRFDRDDLARSLGKARVTDDIEFGLRERWLTLDTDGAALRLTPLGAAEAKRLTRNHRLWETYLLTHADVAAEHVDHTADDVEHVLGPALTRELEMILSRQQNAAMPASPHAIVSVKGGAR
jgi:manganese/zinc/iron transport system permease protein